MINSGSRAAALGGSLSVPATWDAKWSLVVPFKGGPNGKSRLQGHVGRETLAPNLRRELALGFLRDTVTAAAAAESVGCVIIVSSDPAAVMGAAKVQMLPDPGQGLNGAVEAGFALARSLAAAPVAAITADLPCLAVADLEYALEEAQHHLLSVVPDLHGSGSTMITALPGVRIRPRFGQNSRDAHLQAGHILLPIPYASTLRADVDTLEDLTSALRWGVGPNTRAVTLASGVFPPDPVPGSGHHQPRPLQSLPPQRKSCLAF